jgi:YVTN family beta-propeller protein
MKILYSLSKKLLLGGAFVFAANAASAQFELQILHASDLEGGVEAIERAPNFAALVDALEDDYANTILLSAGDNYIPGPFFNAAGEQSVFRDAGVFNNTYNTLFGTADYNGLREGNGRVDISIMNILGFDASAMGNHEFDAGPDIIQTIIEEDFRSPAGPAGDRWVGAQFPYLSANLDFSGDGSLSGIFTSDILFNTDFATGPAESTAGDGAIPKVAPATLIDVNGETIGVVGATTPILASISSPGDVSVLGSGTNDMIELAAILQPTIDAIEALGVNKIILVSHLQQFALEQQLAGLLSGVDVIIAGGSDSILANEDDDLLPEDQGNVFGDYPFETTNADAETVFIVSTNGEYSYVGRLIVNFDANGVVTSAGADSGPYVSTEAKVEEIWGNLVDPFAAGTKGSEVQILVDAVTGIVVAKDGNIFGNTEVFLDGRRSQVRTEETNLGNLTADANLWFAKQIDETVQVSHKNGGGIRAAIGSVVDLGEGNYNFLPPQENPLSGKEEGQVSQLDIENSLRFNNGLTILTLTAEGLVEVIEHSVAASGDGATPGQFGQWGGISFSFDPALAPGSRVQNAVLIDEDGNPTEVLVRNGVVEGDPNRPIRIVSLNFLVGGGDSYPFPGLASDIVQLSAEGGVPQEVIDAGVADFANAGTEQDALAEYLAAEFSDDPFEGEETPAEEDTRIQNLSLRSDNVIPGLTASFVDETTWVSEDGSSVMVAVEVTNLSEGPAEIALMVSPASTAVDGVNYMLESSQMAPVGISELMFEVNPMDDDEVGSTFIALTFADGITPGYEELHTVLFGDNDNEIVEPVANPGIQMSVLASLETPDGAVAEISAHDPVSQRLFVTNSEDNQLLVFDFSDPTVSNIINTIEIDEFGGGINSVAVANGIVAVAVEGEDTGVRGLVVFLDADGNYLGEAEAGFLPDMVTFTPDGTKVLTANEGEPDDDYEIDPVGSVSIIDISAGVDSPVISEATFEAFDGMEDDLRAQGIRIFGPGASASQDFEPEYIVVNPEGTTAYVTLQENNAVAVVDIATATVSAVLPLGYKDYSNVMNQIDASNESGGLFMAPWDNVVGMYQPDAITYFVVDGQGYLVTANEGDARDYDGFSEEERVKDLDLDETAFPYADVLQRDELLGRLNVTSATGDTDGDGDIDVIHNYGARSFTIWNATDGSMVFDSKDQLESITSQDPLWGQFFNSNEDELEFMTRSDDKGPEPEGVITGVIGDRTYAFVILERIGGVVAYDVSNPAEPQFIQYLNNRDPEDGEAGDLAPEGILFVKAEDSPNGENLLVISNEVSGTITVVSLDEVVTPPGVDCEDWVVYQADIRPGGITDIYEVTFEGSDANLELIATSDVEVHIAYNPMDNLLYAVTAADGSYRTLNPHMEDPMFSDFSLINANVGSIHQAAFNNDGKLIIGSSNDDEVYSVDLSDNTVSIFDGFAPTNGGDIAFGEDGTPYLATRAGGGGLYILVNDVLMDDYLIGSVPALVTGMALASTNQLLVSHKDATTLMVRNLDGSPAGSFDLKLNGEPFESFNGDMASGCNTFNDNVGDDCNYALYYRHVANGNNSMNGLYSVELNEDGTSEVTFLTNQGENHIALSPDGSTIYMVGGSNIQTYDVATNMIINNVSVFNAANDANLSGFPAAVTDADGNVFIAGAGNNVWQVDPLTGAATNIASGIAVNGGDLIFAPTGEEGADELWIITRSNNTFRKVLDPGVSFSVDVPEINGAAVLENGNVLLANGDQDGEAGFIEVRLTDLSIVQTYNTELAIFNGDLAGGCTNSEDLDLCDGANGQCYPSSAEYVQGTTSNGGNLSPARTDVNQSLGAPERTDEMVFTTLGYGGSLTFHFEGLVPNGEGDDIEVVETSFNNPGCESYPEYADVSVSQDGETFYYIGTVCKGDAFVDIADAVDMAGAPVALACASYVRVANNMDQTTTPDGFDVDGVVAIHNCDTDVASEDVDETDEVVLAEESMHSLSSYPNPTGGVSQAVFVMDETTRTTLEVYDMNGRVVETLFNQVANEGQQYIIEFDGTKLPNGIYVYRLTTETETIIEKFMIAK